MTIDTHCHFDMMAHPEDFILREEAKGNIMIGMTNLPSHFQMGIDKVQTTKHIRLALGFHPLLAKDNQSELKLFDQFVDKTSYIGEIGLDFSKEGIQSKKEQIDTIRYILSILKDKKKIISVHSRKAEKELLGLLKEYEIKNVIFHWYTGPLSLIKDIEREGYYFSINEAMTRTIHGKEIIASISRDRILTETDAPYNKYTNIKSTMASADIQEYQIQQNFFRLIKAIR